MAARKKAKKKARVTTAAKLQSFAEHYNKRLRDLSDRLAIMEIKRTPRQAAIERRLAALESAEARRSGSR
jgi:hypothetical protein